MKRIAYAPGEERITAVWRRILIGILITLVGINLRSIILGVPPILPLITRDLSLSYTETGLLTAVPTLVLGLTAWPAGLLADRIGPRSCVSLGLLLLGAGAILRAVWANTLALFLFTILLSLGIALSQTAVPILARRWFPAYIGLVSALFSDGLIIGETLAAGLTVPIMLTFLGKDAWAATFVFWGVPILVLLVLWLLLTPQTAPTSLLPNHKNAASAAANTEPTAAMALSAAPIEISTPASKAVKAKKSGVSAWHLGIMIGANSLIYFNLNGWIAPYNQALHHAELTPLALAVLNAAQLPASGSAAAGGQALALPPGRHRLRHLHRFHGLRPHLAGSPVGRVAGSQFRDRLHARHRPAAPAGRTRPGRAPHRPDRLAHLLHRLHRPLPRRPALGPLPPALAGLPPRRHRQPRAARAGGNAALTRQFRATGSQQ